MKLKLFRLIALVVTVCLLVSGCSLADLLGNGGTPFDQMVYTRPDPSQINNSADRCIELAEAASDFDELWSQIENFFTLYSDFCTQYLLSYVHYCKNMQDIYWEEEYNFCEEKTVTVEAARDRLLHSLAKCSFREKLEGEDYFGQGYFDEYEEESIWTDEFQALKAKESELSAQYYQICLEGMELTPYSDEYYDSCGLQLEELFIEMVLVRQQMAREAGYDSYPEYAYKELYDRDYTAADAAGFCEDIRQELVPLYLQLAQSDFWYTDYGYASGTSTLLYLRSVANGMGGTVSEAFEFMLSNDLYDITESENKFDSAFEVYFYDYEQPFVFIAPTGTDTDYLTFVHEFGHFCNDYASYGSVAGIDTAEVFSQGMEYLSLFYGDPNKDFTDMTLGDGLSTYVEQAAYGRFEQQVYELSEEELNVDTLRGLFQTTCDDFGLSYWGLDERGYVDIAHFFIQPMYVISYVVSNDAAFQLYQLERQETGAGLRIYLDSLDTEQEYFLPFLEEAGLSSPFTEGRAKSIRRTLETVLLS